MQRRSSVVYLAALLERLHAGGAARSAFLAMRGELMRKRVRALRCVLSQDIQVILVQLILARFEGSVELYISDLAVVVFTGIKHTADWFLASFRENDTASCVYFYLLHWVCCGPKSLFLIALVQWAKEQIESYAEMFKKQVHGSDVAPQTVQGCMEITRLQSKKVRAPYCVRSFIFHVYTVRQLLKDNSLDFSHLLEQLLALPTPRVSPPSFSRRDPALPSPQLISEAPSILDARPERPPRNLPPRSRDRPASSVERERSIVDIPRREGMF